MAMIIRHERAADATVRERLLDLSFGADRCAKTSERLREGRLPTQGLSFVATESGSVVGTVRLWSIAAGPGWPALLLGPLAVEPEARRRGIGAALMRRAVRDAERLGHRAILLVGDAPYYGRFGFSSQKTADLWLPGAYARERLLALELAPGMLDGAHGLVSGTGRPQPLPELRTLIAAAPRRPVAGVAQAA
jgi:predicted N-acetyltransferase YhbS